MTAYYVAKSGDDSNDGLSWDTARKTIEGGFNVMPNVATATLYIRSGVYAESIDLSAVSGYTSTMYPNFEGVGKVIWDGAGGPTCLKKISGTVYSNFHNLHFRNADIGMHFGGYTSGLYMAQVTGCIFEDCPSWGLYTSCRSGNITFNNNLFVNANIHTAYTTDYFHGDFNRCTFVNSRHNYYAGVIKNCLFWADSPIEFHANLCSSSDWNAYSAVNADYTVGGLTSLAALQATGKDLNSRVEANPMCDPANGVYHLTLTTDLNFAGQLGLRIGAFSPALCLSPAVNAATWNAPYSSTGLLQDGSDYWYPSGTSGEYVSAVLDLGASRQILKIKPVVTMGNTGQVLDQNTGDTYEDLTLEYRGSDEVFAAGDGSPAWTEIELETSLDTAYRYLQFKVTPRTDGVY